MRRVRERRNSGDAVIGKPANFIRRKTKGTINDWRIQCDITGQVCLRSEARKTWRGLIVSNQNWDPRHPQLTINLSTENIAVPDSRPFSSRLSSGGTVNNPAIENGQSLPQVNLTNQVIEGV